MIWPFECMGVDKVEKLTFVCFIRFREVLETYRKLNGNDHPYTVCVLHMEALNTSIDAIILNRRLQWQILVCF